MALNSENTLHILREMPFTNEARKAKLDCAVMTRMQRLPTKKEIHDALDTVEQNWKRILLARKQVLVAGMNYELN